MTSFADLGLSPQWVEALGAEGIEVPTPLQEAAVPVVRRGNNLVAVAGPGAGVLVAWGAPLLDRLTSGEDGAEGGDEDAATPDAEGAGAAGEGEAGPPGGGGIGPADAGAGTGPRALVVCPTSRSALESARSLSRLALDHPLRIAALGSAWALPERADVLFATARELLAELRASRLKLGAVTAVVVDGGAIIQELGELEPLETFLELVPAEAQRVLLALPLTPELADLAERHLRRAVTVPPRAAVGAEETPPRRGSVRYRVVAEDRTEATLSEVAEALATGDVRHVLVSFRSDDRAADVGDLLGLHGYVAGAPGDESVPVWLGVDDRQGRAAVEAAASGSVATVSFDVPAGPDSLDRRHGTGTRGTILALPRELAHLRDVTRRTGYELVPVEEPAPPRLTAELTRIRSRIERALESDDLAAYHLLLEPLYGRYAAAEIAAATLAALRTDFAPASGKAAMEEAPSAAERPAAPAAWVRLFVSVGERDGAGPGDLLGAVTGEAGVDGSKVGKIEVKDTYSIIEVEEPVARQVIRAVNGTSIRGRSARVDYDRGRGGGGGGSRRGGPGRGRASGRGGSGGGSRG